MKKKFKEIEDEALLQKLNHIGEESQKVSFSVGDVVTAGGQKEKGIIIRMISPYPVIGFIRSAEIVDCEVAYPTGGCISKGQSPNGEVTRVCVNTHNLRKVEEDG